MFKGFKKTIIFSLLALTVVLASFTMNKQEQPKEHIHIADDDTVWDIFEKLGKIRINTVNTDIEGVSAEKGKDIVLNGSSVKQNGKGRTSNQSPYFKCTACHNTVIEYDSPMETSAQSRLDYAEKNDLPFLQGTSFYGLVNRKTFYNDDYQKKYGHVPIIKASNTDIRQAIQLCATQCSQGRELEDWEIESVLAYYWTLELKIKDLKLSDEEVKIVDDALSSHQGLPKAVHTLEAHFSDKSAAHFSEHQEYKALDKNKKEDKELFQTGKMVYNRSCLHCHENKRYSFFALDFSRYSFVNLMTRTKANSEGSLYKITRHGTYPLAGKRAYMPLYPIEKLSEEQLDGLRVYVENMAQGNDLLAK